MNDAKSDGRNDKVGSPRESGNALFCLRIVHRGSLLCFSYCTKVLARQKKELSGQMKTRWNVNAIFGWKIIFL